MVKKLLVITAATAIAGFVGAANAGDTPDLLGSINLKPDQVLLSKDMSKVVGTSAAVAAAGAAGATSGNFATANQFTSANAFNAGTPGSVRANGFGSSYVRVGN